jgi:hypothetical protein
MGCGAHSCKSTRVKGNVWLVCIGVMRMLQEAALL